MEVYVLTRIDLLILLSRQQAMCHSKSDKPIGQYLMKTKYPDLPTPVEISKERIKLAATKDNRLNMDRFDCGVQYILSELGIEL